MNFYLEKVLSWPMETLITTKILQQIDQNAAKKLNKIEVLPLVDSTNSYLLRFVKTAPKELSAGGYACFAEQQSAGRGRQGKVWCSDSKNNIYFSCLWVFEKLNYPLSTLSMVIAVSVAKFLDAYSLNKLGLTHAIQLKWPNDILINGKKIAGILLESNLKKTITIGIGLNIMPVNKEILPDAVSLFDLHAENGELLTFQSNQIAGGLLNATLDAMMHFEESGADVFFNEWKKWDCLINHEVIIFNQDKHSFGFSRGVNDQGQLLFEDGSGKITPLNSGDVSIRRTPL